MTALFAAELVKLWRRRLFILGALASLLIAGLAQHQNHRSAVDDRQAAVSYSQQIDQQHLSPGQQRFVRDQLAIFRSRAHAAEFFDSAGGGFFVGLGIYGTAVGAVLALLAAGLSIGGELASGSMATWVVAVRSRRRVLIARLAAVYATLFVVAITACALLALGTLVIGGAPGLAFGINAGTVGKLLVALLLWTAFAGAAAVIARSPLGAVLLGVGLVALDGRVARAASGYRFASPGYAIHGLLNFRGGLGYTTRLWLEGWTSTPGLNHSIMVIVAALGLALMLAVALFDRIDIPVYEGT